MSDAVLNNVDLVRYLLTFCANAPTVVAARKTCTLFRAAASDDVLCKVAHWRELPRELHPRMPPPACIGCKGTIKGMAWKYASLYCPECRCITFLPPPAPRVVRFTPRHTHYVMPKLATSTMLFVQIKPHNEWITVCTTNTRVLCSPRACCPMRVAARLGACRCQSDNSVECFRNGKCMWTPWSEVTPC